MCGECRSLHRMLKLLINLELTNCKTVFHVASDVGQMNHTEKNNVNKKVFTNDTLSI